MQTVPLLTWNSSYSVNVKSCDAQHQKLFSLINELHDAMKLGQGRKVLANIVSELEKYVQSHFSAEEALMQKAHYAKLGEHRAQHMHFTAQVAQFRKDLGTEDGGDVIAVLAFLKDWLTGHIQQADKMYSSHLNSHGIN